MEDYEKKYNSLADDYNSLAEKYNSLREEYFGKYYPLLHEKTNLQIRFNINEMYIKAEKKERRKLKKKVLKLYNDAMERCNALSKENNKLREKNELMQERLRNLGIKDFDFI